MKLQLIEGDRLGTPDAERDNKLFDEGVQHDHDGLPIRYWVRDTYPEPRGFTSGPDEYKGIDALGKKSGRAQALHLFVRTRPGLARGIPYLAPVIEPLKQIERITEAELTATVIASFFTVFVETESGDDGLANETLDDSTDTGNVDSKTRDLELAPGAIVDLARGEKINTATPNRPNAGFDPFVAAVMGQISIALELPPEVLQKHFSSSFSAAKAAIIEAWRFFNKRRAWVASNFCAEVYEWAIAEAVAEGMIRAPGFDSDPMIREAYLRATWTGPAAGMIDPVKEIKSLGDQRDRGWVSDQEATVQIRGANYEDVAVLLERGAKIRDDHGLEEFKPQAAGPASSAPTPPGGDESEEEEGVEK